MTLELAAAFTLGLCTRPVLRFAVRVIRFAVAALRFAVVGSDVLPDTPERRRMLFRRDPFMF